MAVVLAAYGVMLPALSVAVERFVAPAYALDAADPATFLKALVADRTRVLPLVVLFLTNLLLVRPVVEGAILAAAGTPLLKQDGAMTFASAYRASWRRIGPLVAALTLQVMAYLGVVAVAGALGFALLFVNLWLALVTIPLAIAAIALLGLEFSFIAEAVVLEDRGALAALGRSRELARGHLGRITLVYLLGLAATLLLGRVFSLVSGVVAPGSAFVATLGDMLATVLGLPFAWTSFVVLYVDIRVRKEGLDLERRADRILGDAVEVA